MVQETLFKFNDESKGTRPSYDPFSHQKSRSEANSAIALENLRKSQRHISQKNRIKAFLMANQVLITKRNARVLKKGLTLDEIAIGTGIGQKGTITGRFADLRENGFDLLNNHGQWGIVKR